MPENSDDLARKAGSSGGKWMQLKVWALNLPGLLVVIRIRKHHFHNLEGDQCKQAVGRYKADDDR